MNQSTLTQSAQPTRRMLPFGCHDLNPVLVQHHEDPDRVRCFVRGCRHFVLRPRPRQRGEACPVHGIYCHSSSAGRTYTYATVQHNIIASPELFARHIIGHPFKYESHRLGYERSEDAVSWNVWRSLDEAKLLSRIGQWITGIESQIQPRLYLWGLEISDDVFEPWSLLIAARDRFESNLPVDRPKTEPDIALHLPGKYLILIEAKFTSPNTAYRRGPRKDGSSLTLEELIAIYQDRSLEILDRSKAENAERVYYQLWRNTVFAEWMAKFDHGATQAFHVNLVREGYEEETAAEFNELVHPHCKQRFRRITWEQIHQLFADEPCVARMRQYLELKTAGLLPAFQLRRSAR